MTLKPQVKMNLQPISFQKSRTPRRAVFCMFLNTTQYGASFLYFCMFETRTVRCMVLNELNRKR